MTTHLNSPKPHSTKQNPSTGESHGSVGSAVTPPWAGEERRGGQSKGERETHQQSASGEGEISSVFLMLSLKATPLEDCLNTTLPRKCGQECGLSLRTNHPLIPKYKCDPDGTK